jgi:UDP-3-O-[3-hydroxymyristoyl] glucosamine N-acyltransferase
VVGAHLKVADDVILAGRSTITNNVTEAGQYGGYPLQPLREALKTLVTIGQLNDMRKSLNGLIKTAITTQPAVAAHAANGPLTPTSATCTEE